MNAGALYDSLPEDKRDMTRENFIREIKRLTDLRQMRSDLQTIIGDRQIARTRQLYAEREKRKIDGAVQNG